MVFISLNCHLVLRHLQKSGTEHFIKFIILLPVWDLVALLLEQSRRLGFKSSGISKPGPTYCMLLLFTWVGMNRSAR